MSSSFFFYFKQYIFKNPNLRWYYKGMVFHILASRKIIFENQCVALSFIWQMSYMKFVVLINLNWKYNSIVCNLTKSTLFAPCHYHPQHFQWPLQCVELMKRSAVLWFREMGPTTVTWPDWATGSQEITRIVMIRIFGEAAMSQMQL